MRTGDGDPAQRKRLWYVVLHLIGMVALGTAGVMLLQIGPPSPRAGIPLFVGYCFLYYGGFTALVAAIWVLLVRLPTLLDDYRGHS